MEQSKPNMLKKLQNSATISEGTLALRIPVCIVFPSSFNLNWIGKEAIP